MTVSTNRLDDRRDITAILSPDAGFSLAVGDFVNPSYLGSTSTGFDISGGETLALAFEGTYGSVTMAHEQTLDPSGAAGWFSVAGVGSAQTTASATVAANGALTGFCYVFPVIGVRHRMRLTALASGTIVCRAALRAGQAPQGAVAIVAASGASAAAIQGQAAHDAAIAGSPVRVGLRALTSEFTDVATGDQVDAVGTVGGKQIVLADAIPEATWNYAAASGGIAATTTAVTIKASAGAGKRNYVKALQVQTDTLGNATELAIRDGAAGTVLWRTKLGTGPLPLTGITFEPPLRGSAATLLEVVTLTSATGAVMVNAQGYAAA